MTGPAPALLIAGGTVHTPSGPVDADVRVEGGRIASVEPRGRPAGGAEVVDATGLLVLPGAIDVHVHGRDPGQPEKETFDTLTAAAAAGGVTTVFDMPNTIPGVDGPEAFRAKLEAVSSRARVDFGLWGLVRSGSTAEQVEGLAAAGAIGLKAYLGYSWDPAERRVLYSPVAAGGLEPPADYGTLARLAPAIRRAGLRLGVHAEDAAILAAFHREASSYSELLESRPAAAEAVAVAAVGALSRETGLGVHLCHLASAAGLSQARAARHAGADLSVETCPQYLWLSDDDAARLGPRLKGFPLVRTAADREALRAGLWEQDVQVVATDHAPHTDPEKEAAFSIASPGNPGVQTLLVSCLELARLAGDLGAATRWVSWWPARLFGLEGRKGAIEPGADADLVLVDPAGRTVAGPETALSKQRRSPMDGIAFGFSIRSTYVRGRLVARDGRPAEGPPAGLPVRP